MSACTGANSPANEMRSGRRKFDAALVALFVIALCVPTIGRLTGWAPPFDPSFEKRAAATFPVLHGRRYGPLIIPRKGNLLAFPNAFDAYFGDQLGFRANLVGLYTRAAAAGWVPPTLTKSSGGAAHGPVLVGRDGWLYLNGACVENYRNTRPFSEAELDAWVTAVKQRRDWLAQRGIAYLFFVAPDKQTIYPEFLPRSVNQVRPQSRLDQLMEHLRGVEGLTAIDLRPALLAGKAHSQTYYRIDTHWNERGAWIGYQEICRSLAKQIPQMRPLTLDDFAFTPLESRQGDLSLMIPASTWTESNPERVVRKGSERWTVREVNHVLKNGEYGSGRRTENPTVPAGRTVVIHDSFFWSLAPYLSEHWREMAQVNNSVVFPTELIEREQPLLVIDEYVERKLLGPAPANPPEMAPPNAGLQWAKQPSKDVRR